MSCHACRVVQQTSKRCPACQMAISKTEGCNKMVCAYCSAAWCWRCERVIGGYEHFRCGRGVYRGGWGRRQGASMLGLLT
jgi:hypothetical protein